MAATRIPVRLGSVAITTGTATSQTLTFAAPDNRHRQNTSGNTTFTWAGATDGYTFTLMVVITSAGHTLTFNTTTWPNNTAAPTWPTTAGTRLVISFICESTTVRCTGFTQYTS